MAVVLSVSVMLFYEASDVRNNLEDNYLFCNKFVADKDVWQNGVKKESLLAKDVRWGICMKVEVYLIKTVPILRRKW